MKFSTEVCTTGGTRLQASVGFDVEGAQASFEKKGRAFLQVGIRFEQQNEAGYKKLAFFIPAGEWPAIEASAARELEVVVGPQRYRLRLEDVLGELRAVVAVAKSVHVEGQRGCLRDAGAQAVAS